MDNNLKQCPLCGKDVKVDSIDVGGYSYYTIVCETCGFNIGPRHNVDQAIESWNCRSDKVQDESIYKFLEFLNNSITKIEADSKSASDLYTSLTLSKDRLTYKLTKEILVGFICDNIK